MHSTQHHLGGKALDVPGSSHVGDGVVHASTGGGLTGISACGGPVSTLAELIRGRLSDKSKRDISPCNIMRSCVGTWKLFYLLRMQAAIQQSDQSNVLNGNLEWMVVWKLSEFSPQRYYVMLSYSAAYTSILSMLSCSDSWLQLNGVTPTRISSPSTFDCMSTTNLLCCVNAPPNFWLQNQLPSALSCVSQTQMFGRLNSMNVLPLRRGACVVAMGTEHCAILRLPMSSLRKKQVFE
eukprot:Gb_25921 [translate_table: standard]